MFENLGPAELLLIFLVILIFFGPKKIPELAASLGKGIRKFNDAKDGLETQIKTVMKEPLDAINEAKSGLESKLMEASQPLRDTLLPTTQFATANNGPASSTIGDSTVIPTAVTDPPQPISPTNLHEASERSNSDAAPSDAMASHADPVEQSTVPAREA